MDETASVVEVRLSRDLTFLRATMMGIAATVGPGIFVLLGFATAAGPALLLAIALNGLVAGLTAITYADLGTTFPEAGGGYLWAREALPSPMAFGAGWLTWFGHMLAGAVAALGFGYYLGWSLDALDVRPLRVLGEPMLTALLVTSVFVALGVVGARTRRWSLGFEGFAKLSILVVLIAFGLVGIARAGASGPFPGAEASSILAAMTLTFIAFPGFEVIAQAGEEIRDPEHTIPRAMFFSLAVVVTSYMAVAFVALAFPASRPPQALENFGPVAIVELGRRAIPWVGAPLLAAAGLVATLSALNATLFSASRLSFAMGRDQMLPKSLGRVHTRFHAPSAAILLSGIVTLVLVLVSDLRVVATSAGLSFLLAFVLVDVALVRWRLKHPEVRRGFTAPLFPAFPVLGVAANLVLAWFLVTQPGTGQLAWAVIVLWLGVGLLLYYPFRLREGVARPLPKRVDVAQILAAEAPPVELEKYRVLVPLREFTNVALVRLGAAFAAARHGELALMNVLEIPRTLPPKAIRFHYVDERIRGLHKLERVARAYGVDTRATVRIGHLPYEIVLRTIEEEDVNLLVLGWRGDRQEGEVRILGDTIDYLVQRAPCDVVVARTGALKEGVRSVLLYARAADHAIGSAELAAILAAPSGAKVTVLEVAEDGKPAPPSGDDLATALRRTGLAAEVKRVPAKNPVEAVVAESAGHDLLVLGAGERWALRKYTFGPLVDEIASKAKCPVVMFRKGGGIASPA